MALFETRFQTNNGKGLTGTTVRPFLCLANQQESRTMPSILK